MLDVPSLQLLQQTEAEVPNKTGTLSDPKELLVKLSKKGIQKLVEPYAVYVGGYEALVGMSKTSFNRLSVEEMVEVTRSSMDRFQDIYEQEMANIREDGEKGGDALGYQFGSPDVFSRSTAPKSRDAGDLGHMGGEESPVVNVRRHREMLRQDRERKEAESLARLKDLEERKASERAGRFIQKVAQRKKPQLQQRIQEREEEARRQEENRRRYEGLSQRRRRPIKPVPVAPTLDEEIARLKGKAVREELLKKVGHGLPFGKYFLNEHKIKDDIVAVYNEKGRNHPHMPTKRVSKSLGKVLRHIAGGGNPSYDDLHRLSEEDRSHLSDLVRKCKVDVDVPEGDNDLEQFDIMQGEIGAGNDSPELIKKFKVLILKLMNRGRLPKGQAREILADLVALGF
jgi:hypothetical protein